MKVILDARMYGLENAGIGRYLINLLKELQTIDFDNRYIVLLRKKYYRGLKLNKNFEKVQADFRHYSVSEQINLPKILNKHKSALVHFPHFNIPLNFHGKFAVTLHDLTMHKQGKEASNLGLPEYYIKRPIYKYIYKKAVTDSVQIITPTKQVKNEIVDYYEVETEKIRVIYEGLNDVFALEVPPILQDKIIKKHKLKISEYFIYVGNIYPHKNIARAIEAIKFFNKKNEKKYILAIVSSRNVFTNKLLEIIKHFNAEESVKLLGFIEDSELAVLLKNSRAFVYPSLSEGFGLPGLEAMSAGTLVMASDITVFQEVYERNALYFNPFDFTAIAHAMDEVANMSKKSRDRKIAKSQKFIKRYSWSKMAKQTLKVYKQSLRHSV